MSRFAALLVASVWVASAAIAGEGYSNAPLRDPWMPPGARGQAPQAAQLQGPALHAQVQRKLRASFDAADVERRGSITLEQARAAQLGFVAENFAAMDASHSGRVTFEDVARFLHARGARTF